MDKIQPVLCHLLPLINGIVALDLDNSTQLVDIYDVENSKEITEQNMKMMEKTRLLNVRYGTGNWVSLKLGHKLNIWPKLAQNSLYDINLKSVNNNLIKKIICRCRFKLIVLGYFFSSEYTSFI
jgi:hypothetical protein